MLDVLETGMYNNSFSKREKRQTEEVNLFKAICREKQCEPLQQFCTQLFEGIHSSIVKRAVSVDIRRETSYKLLYEKPVNDLNKLWNMLFFGCLSLSQYGHRVLFNEELVASILPVYFRLPASIVVCAPQICELF